jgi:predicted CXXCH cytochrome family protein
MPRATATLALLGAVLLAVPGARAGVESTVHNLAASGPGTVRAPEVVNVCVFCHTPHNANPSRALWNHALPGVTYQPYASSTLAAEVDQPTGASRLCLSCHDGTLALGLLNKPERGVQPALGPLTGRTVVGTDLSDDHPVSFVYDSELALRSGELADPSVLPQQVKLDDTGQLQCTSCHDPHEDRLPDFLVLDPQLGALCLACHRPEGWGGSVHATSPATWNGTGTDPWPESDLTTVAENACENCHRQHGAPHPERLLSALRDEDVCLTCHNGNVAPEDVAQDFHKLSTHPVEAALGLHDPREDPLTMPRHVACQDCHDPHEVTALPVPPPGVPGAMEGASGVTAAGGVTERATFGYEVCFKCHGVTDDPSPIVVRADGVTNVRVALAATNASYHPVVAIGRDPMLMGFEPGYAATSVIGCVDCHGSDSSTRAGGAGPDGPHGSLFEPILEREYHLEGSPLGESFGTYRLCYKCHTRTAVLRDAQPFPHREHVVDDGASCAICHDAHGSPSNAALVNFMLSDPSGQPVVTPSGSGRLELQSAGAGSGLCYLTCHGKDHDPEGYGIMEEMTPEPLRGRRRGLRKVAPPRLR